MLRAVCLATLVAVATARRGGGQHATCKYEKVTDLEEGLKGFGCDTVPKANGKFDCSAKCAHHYMPIERRCKIMFNKLKLDEFTKDCRETLHPQSEDTETGRECRDGKDNDHDGKADCQDPDCKHTRHCKRENPNTESGPECHDGHDNDHDGKDDCQDPDCAKHPCCSGACERKKFAAAHKFCSQPYCKASKNKGTKQSCASSKMLPVVLSCQVWMKHAMADGEIDGKDHFCTSSCYENIQDNYEPCEDRMNDATKTQLADAVKLSRTCTGNEHETTKCNMAHVTKKCGNNVDAASGRCNGRCIRAIDAMVIPCKAEPAFKNWEKVLHKCADTHDAENCAAASNKFLSFVDSSCCKDSKCSGTPDKCTEECAATFMPYFSRCGRAIFGKQRPLLKTMERFNRKCAYTAGRNVHKVPDGSKEDPYAQLDGPIRADICSKHKNCKKCRGACGWCAAEVENKHALHANGGGWCSSECVTTSGECKAHGGAKNKETGKQCFDGKDNDGDGKSDCDDKDCKKDPRSRLLCKFTETGRECFDGKDNDHDGHSDCADQDCLNNPAVRARCRAMHRHVNHETGKACFDGIDNDKDHLFDCDDPDCRKDPRSAAHCKHTETGKECFDGRDNDRDGKTDCQDKDCLKDKRAAAHCRGIHTHHETGKQCFDGIDNDHDGVADCDDPDCQKDRRAKGHCARTETGKECFDGRDNDKDGKTDCQDSNCLNDPSYGKRVERWCRKHKGGKETGRQCFDHKDNDGDGVADCDDPDCRRDPRAYRHCAHTETGKECFDGKDNDHDGKTDCDDPDCLNDLTYGNKVKQHCAYIKAHGGDSNDH